MSDNMHNFVLYQGVKDKIAATLTSLGLNKCKHHNEITEKTFEEVKIISKAYGNAIDDGYAEDMVPDNNNSYSTLHFLMDIIIIQTLRAAAARYGVVTELLHLNIKGEDDGESD